MFYDEAWSVVDFFDAPVVLDASITAIPGNAGAFLQVVASLAHTCHRLVVIDGIGDRFIGLYVGGSGSETLACIIGAGSDPKIDLYIPKNTRISLRSMGAAAITTNNLSIQFMGIGYDTARLRET